MGLNRTPMSIVLADLIGQELLCSISSTSIYYVPESDIRVKSFDLLNFLGASVVHFLASWYIMGLNHTTNSKVMAVWIGQELSCSISNLSMYYAPELDIQVKGYDLLNFLRDCIVHFQASPYIVRVNHTIESKVMAVWICRELLCSILSVSIYYALESDIRVKSYDHLNFLRASVVQFQVSRYIMGTNHTPESKVTVVWIFRELSCQISSVSIYYALESDIWVKSYDYLNFSRASVVQFRASRYIMFLNHTPMSKVMTVGISRELSCSISSVSIYYVLEPNILVKSYDHLDFLGASVFHLWASWFIMGLTRTPELKVTTVWICRELSCSISSVSIYYVLEPDILVKSYDHLDFLGASVFHLWASWFIMGLTRTPELKVTTVWICRELSCLISSFPIYYALELDIRMKSNDHLNFSSFPILSISIYHGPQSYTHVNSYRCLNWSRAFVVQFRVSQYIMCVNHITESKVMAVWICRELSCSISSEKLSLLWTLMAQGLT